MGMEYFVNTYESKGWVGAMVVDDAVSIELRELRDRVDHQRLVLCAQGEILDALGFDVADIADASEPETKAPPRGRGCALAIGACTWVTPGPFWIAQNAHMLYRLMLLFA